MKNETSHSIMFHHFHNKVHKPVQGSISEFEFRKILVWLSDNYSLLGAAEYSKKFENKTLRNNDICLSFDDALKCQYDIAFPILKEFGIDAFFFIYTSILTEDFDYLEIYRYFRNSAYEDINDFYNEFFEKTKEYDPKVFMKKLSEFSYSNYLSNYPFYSKNDKLFRFIRDKYLSEDEYSVIMNQLMLEKKFDISLVKTKLWMTEQDLFELYKSGFTLGLHSHNHINQMHSLSKSQQEMEYRKNYEYLSKITCSDIYSMSHPCGNYNDDTISVLSELGMKIGFKANMSLGENRSPFEIPRRDHTYVYKEIMK